MKNNIKNKLLRVLCCLNSTLVLAGCGTAERNSMTENYEDLSLNNTDSGVAESVTRDVCIRLKNIKEAALDAERLLDEAQKAVASLSKAKAEEGNRNRNNMNGVAESKNSIEEHIKKANAAVNKAEEAQKRIEKVVADKLDETRLSEEIKDIVIAKEKAKVIAEKIKQVKTMANMLQWTTWLLGGEDNAYVIRYKIRDAVSAAEIFLSKAKEAVLRVEEAEPKNIPRNKIVPSLFRGKKSDKNPIDPIEEDIKKANVAVQEARKATKQIEEVVDAYNDIRLNGFTKKGKFVIVEAKKEAREKIKAIAYELNKLDKILEPVSKAKKL